MARWLETPIGAMLAIGDQYGLHLLEFFDRTALPTEIARLQTHTGPIPFGTCPMLETVAAQLSAWFRDARSPFSVPVVQRGSAFEQTVWAELQRIPPGETRTYGGLAREIGRPQAGRAVGRANGANQVAVIVPCHRVIGADGALTGYGGNCGANSGCWNMSAGASCGWILPPAAPETGFLTVAPSCPFRHREQSPILRAVCYRS